MDWSLTRRLNAFVIHHDRLADALTTYERLGEALFVLALLILLTVGGRALRRGAVSGAAATALALAVGQVVSRLVERPRPFVTHPAGVHLVARHAADAGFPSDHATAAFAIAVAVWTHDRRWGAALLALAAVLAAGRVALGLHYPSDVLAGAAIGTLAAIVVTHGALGRRLDGLADRLRDRRAFRVPGAMT